MTANAYDCLERASDKPDMKSRTGFTLIELLIVLGLIALLVAFLLPLRRNAGPAARRSQCTNNLKQIGLALHNYEETYHALPPAYTVDADGRPLHSWRTLILPFIEQQPLYDTIDLSKPWNDSANATAFNTVLPVFQCPEDRRATTDTPYLAVKTWDGCFLPDKPRKLSEITDGHSDTIMVLEVPAVHSVHWMSPLDADEGVVLGLGSEDELPHNGVHQAVSVDGSIRTLSGELRAEVLRAMISIAGNERIGDF